MMNKIPIMDPNPTEPEPIFDPSKVNFSFAGCGFLGIYHVGAASCLRDYVPHLVKNNKCSGASAGAIAAVLLLSDGSLEEITKSLIECASLANSRPAGPFSPSVNIHSMLRKDLDRILPHDAHHRVNGKLRISLTKVPKIKCLGLGVPNFLQRQNMVVTHFDSREEVLDAVMCATFIPGFSGISLPEFRGDTVLDGGMTDNCPGLDSWTIRINPYAGDAHISPKEPAWTPFKFNISNTSFQLTLKNICRLKNTFIPPDPETLKNFCTQGFNDTYAFLKKRGWIPTPPENPQFFPQNIQEIFDEDKENYKSGPISLRKIYSYTPVRIWNAFNLPWLVAVEGAVLAGSKVVQQPLVQEALTPLYTLQPVVPRNYERIPKFTTVLPSPLSAPVPVPIPILNLNDLTIEPMEFSEEIVEDYYNSFDRRASILVDGELVTLSLSRRPSFIDLDEDGPERLVRLDSEYDSLYLNSYS